MSFTRNICIYVGLFAISLFVTGCGSGESDSAVTAAAPSEQALSKKATTTFTPELVPTVYRFAKISNGAYFYTGSEVEAQTIISSYPDFRYEGPAFERDTCGQGQQVFRFANLTNGGYFYTGSEAERDQVLANYPNMRFEGSTFSVAPQGQVDSRAVYRLANLVNGAYLFTLSAAERDYAVSLGMWRAEGTSFAAPRGSPLSDRYWRKGLLLEDNDISAQQYEAGVDDNGGTLTLFVKTINNRAAIFARSGKLGTNGSFGLAPLIQIDLDLTGAALTKTSENFSFKQSPNGNAIVVWRFGSFCSTSSYNLGGGSNACTYVGYATYNAATNQWAPAKALTDSPDQFGTLKPKPYINDRGDAVIVYNDWIRTGVSTFSYANRLGVARRPTGQADFQITRYDDVAYGPLDFSLDEQGNILLVVEVNENSTTNISALSGSVQAGLSPGVLLEERTSPAKFVALRTSKNGRSAVFYQQTDSNGDYSLFGAVRNNGEATWSLTNFKAAYDGSSVSQLRYFATDDDIIKVVDMNGCGGFNLAKDKRIGLDWKFFNLPIFCKPPSFSDQKYITFNKNGDYFWVDFDSSGELLKWVSFDAARNKFIQGFPTNQQEILNDVFVVTGNKYVFGFVPTTSNWKSIALSLSSSGRGFMIADGNYDTLPTINAKGGDGRSTVSNLFGFYFN